MPLVKAAKRQQGSTCFRFMCSPNFVCLLTITHYPLYGVKCRFACLFMIILCVCCTLDIHVRAVRGLLCVSKIQQYDMRTPAPLLTFISIFAAGGNAEEEAEAREVCKEAEITTICADSVEAAETKNLDSTPDNFKCVCWCITFACLTCAF